MSSSTFSQTRSSALNLEKQTESLLSRYSQFQNQSSVEASEEEISLHQSIQETLEKRDSILGKLNRISESMDNLSTSKLQQLTRHREILSDHKTSFAKISSSIADERNRNNLLFSIRSDIDAHKQQRTNLGGNGEINANDYVLEERQRVDNANSFADRLLQSAFNTRDELLSQRQYLNNAQSKMFSTLQQIPGINVLISKINTRRKRDTFILAGVISVCIVVLFFL
ncbi:uncharacterized protein RJT20DRAFT_57143 [Scheffersomyces xylosifermentans]|uniref:uncharacterized protein n=1 Tax=Scheffersomyces xylosifermentans TaxID=1304137 RepID=UPI00315D7161